MKKQTQANMTIFMSSVSIHALMLDIEARRYVEDNIARGRAPILL
jgi:hypothetical protein